MNKKPSPEMMRQVEILMAKTKPPKRRVAARKVAHHRVARPLTKGADAYVGRKECGCLVAVVFDDPRFKKDTAKTVGEFIKSGYRVEHVVWDEVKGSLGRCKCPKKAA